MQMPQVENTVCYMYILQDPPPPQPMPLIKTGVILCDDHEVRLDSAVRMKRAKLTAPSTFQPNLLISGSVLWFSYLY